MNRRSLFGLAVGAIGAAAGSAAVAREPRPLRAVAMPCFPWLTRDEMVTIGESGPELITLPREGAVVVNANLSASLRPLQQHMVFDPRLALPTA